MLKTYFFLSLFFAGISSYGQRAYEDKVYSNQLELRHDNDFFVLTDRYYSSGLFITYRTTLEKGVFGDAEQLSFKLG